jgi:hypothetical protein
METDEARGMNFYYSKTHPVYADTRCYVLPHIGQQGNNTWLCRRFSAVPPAAGGFVRLFAFSPCNFGKTIL